MNRAMLESRLAENIADGMDWETMYAFVVETLLNEYSKLNDEDFEQEVRDFAPHLLDEVVDN